MTSLFHTYVLTLKQQICEVDLLHIRVNFETPCNSGYAFSKPHNGDFYTVQISIFWTLKPILWTVTSF